jgi:hypothetical protein
VASGLKTVIAVGALRISDFKFEKLGFSDA